MASMMEELTRLGKEIDSAKKSIATLDGRKAELMERLQKDYGVKTVDDAEKLLAKIRKQLDVLDEEINASFKELKDNFSW